MQLTALEFAKLINDLKCDVRPGERRTNPRAPTRAIIEVHHVDPDTSSPPKSEMLRVRDISRNGLGLLVNRQLKEFSRLIVLMPKSATETLMLLCEVVRVQRLPGDMYQLGTRMVRRVTPLEFMHYLAHVPGAAAALTVDPPPTLTDAA